MKQLLLSLMVTAGVAAMSSAYAQSTPADSQPMDQTQAQSGNASDTGQGGVNWGSAAQGTRNGPLSRQDVRQQLIQSERDGQLSTLDNTLYKGN